MKPSINTVDQLVGEQISAIAFVLDYVEFHFSGPVLRSLSHPSVASNTSRMCFPEPGSRDALCCVIGSTVQSVKLDEKVALELTTSNDLRITIPLDSRSRRGPEAMHFIPEVNKPIQVW